MCEIYPDMAPTWPPALFRTPDGIGNVSPILADSPHYSPAPNLLNTGWRQLTARMSGPDNQHGLFLDGILIGSNQWPTASFLGDLVSSISIGYAIVLHNGNTSRNIASGIDEMEVSSVARSANWIWASWKNQGANAAFSIYGPVSANGRATGAGLVIF